MTPFSWPEILEPGQRSLLANLLLEYVRPRRWFRGKGRTPRAAVVADLIPVDSNDVVVILRIEYASVESDLYAVPLARIEGARTQSNRRDGTRRDEAAEAGPAPEIVTGLGKDGCEGAIVDGLLAPGRAADALLNMIRDGGSVRGETGGHLRGEFLPPMAEMSGVDLPTAKLPRVEQTNSTAIFGDQVLLKIYRQLTAGANPELEIGRYLTAHCDRPCAPRVLGALFYQSPDGTDYSLGIAHEYLPNDGDAFSYVLTHLRSYFARVVAQRPPESSDRGATGNTTTALLARARGSAVETPASRAVGPFLRMAATLGQRTGELHLALGAAAAHDIDFAAEQLTSFDRAQLAERTETMLNEQLRTLSAALPRLEAGARALAERLLAPAALQNVFDSLSRFREREIAAVKTRTHGDLHLGQVLVRGEDFVIIDFEGEPARPLAERRAKSSPLRDVMGMIRSFDYAPEVLLRDPATSTTIDAAPASAVQLWATSWKREVTAAYLRAYLTTVRGAAFLPVDDEELALLLTFHELEKVIYEIGYEVNNRPAWVEIPLRGLAGIAGLRDGSTEDEDEAMRAARRGAP